MTTTPKQEAHTTTPLTDAVINNIVERSKPYTAHIYTKLSEHARTLERRNSALVAALAEAVACHRNAHPEPYWMQDARRALELARTPTPGGKP